MSVLSIISQSRPKYKYQFRPSYTRLAPVEVDSSGVLVKKSEFREDDSYIKLNQYQSNDFEIANILAIGAYDTLKPVYMSHMSDISVADAFEKSVSSIPVNPQNVEPSK